jgi:hypothetical protein
VYTSDAHTHGYECAIPHWSPSVQSESEQPVVALRAVVATSRYKGYALLSLRTTDTSHNTH